MSRFEYANPALLAASTVRKSATKKLPTGGGNGSGISGFAVLLTFTGLAVAYSAVKGRSITSTIQTLLKGQAPSDSNSDHATAIHSSSAGAVANNPTLPSGAGPKPANQNQRIAQMLCAPLGWNTGANWTSLVALWNKESGWSNTADTRQSGFDPGSSNNFAFGISQARPYYKLPKAGWPVDKGGQADPTAQIRWGLAYIKGRYGNPVAAWNHETANNWY